MPGGITISGCNGCGHTELVALTNSYMFECPRCGMRYAAVYESLMGEWIQEEWIQERSEVPSTTVYAPQLRDSLPPGFRWMRDPHTYGVNEAIVTVSESHVAYGRTATGGRALIAERVKQLVQWAQEQGVLVLLARNTEVLTSVEVNGEFREVLVSAPQRFGVRTREWYDVAYGPTADPHVPLQTPVPCGCGEEHPFATVVCPTTGLPVICPSCRQGSATGLVVDGNEWVCEGCGVPCGEVECDRLCSTLWTYCSEHAERRQCVRCMGRFEEVEGAEPLTMEHETHGTVCYDCAADICPRCENFSEVSTYVPAYDEVVCRRCHREYLSEATEVEDDDDGSIAELPSIPGRESIRMCGVEIEGARGEGNGSTLALELYEAGLARYDSMMSYHHGNSGFVHVENDSTVDWEAVVGPINMADSEDTERLNRVMRIIREGVREGKYKLDLRCGVHIHVGAERVGISGAYTLNNLFSFLEDPLYRMAAARWPIHRAMQGSDYCRPLPKKLTKLLFGNTHRSGDARYFGLNFSNYFRRMMEGCSCGAVSYGVWEECTCDVGKCTFEFRLFNTTANPRKMHAYLALCQALVAKALGMPEIKNPEQDYPVLAFNQTPFQGMPEEDQATLKEEWKSRLAWMAAELPFTHEERQSLRYVIDHSELAVVGDDFMESILPKEVAA